MNCPDMIKMSFQKMYENKRVAVFRQKLKLIDLVKKLKMKNYTKKVIIFHILEILFID